MTRAAEYSTKFCPVLGFVSCSGPSLVARRIGRPYGTCSQGLLGTEIMRRWRREESTVHGFDICVIHKLAGQPSYLCSQQLRNESISAAFVTISGKDLPVYVIQFPFIPEVRPIDGKLIKRIQLPFHMISTLPRVRARALEHEHPVVDRRTAEGTHGVE